MSEKPILDRIKLIINRFDEISHEDIGPWSEVSEVMEQEREAHRYIQGREIAPLQEGLSKEIIEVDDPWEHIQLIYRYFQPKWVTQPYKFFNAIVLNKQVSDSIAQIIPKVASQIESDNKCEDILISLVQINPTIRQQPEIVAIIKKLMKKRKLDPILISHSLVLEEPDAEAMTILEKSMGQVPYIEEKMDLEIEKNVEYGEGATSRIKQGYHVENGRVVGLGVNDRVVDSIPESLGDLTEIRILCLNNLKLSALPESIGNLKKLEGLYIDSNQLKTLPKSIGDCESLEELYIRKNKLKSFPASFGKLSSLRRIMAQDSSLRKLPVSMKKLENLEEFYLQGTKLTADQIQPLHGLEKLDLKWIYFCMGETLMYEGNTEEAVKAHIELLKIDNKERYKEKYNLGNMLNTLGRYDEAEHYLKDAVNFKKYKIQALISLGYTYYFQGKLDKAAETFDLALKEKPKKTEQVMLMVNLGGVYLAQAKLDEAEAILNKGLKLETKNGDIHYNLACLFARKDDSPTSLKHLEKAVKYKAVSLSNMEVDTDLDSIRDTDEYKKLLAKYKSS